MRTEAQLRRLATRHGLLLHKSRRDGTFMLVDPTANFLLAGNANEGYGLSEEDVEEFLVQT